MSVANGTFTRTNSFGEGGPRNIARFFMDSIQDEAATVREGRPIFKQVERVEIILPGNPHTRPVFNVTDEHRQQYAKEYEAFKQGLEMAPEGTPIEEWPILNRAQVLELKALGFYTVENIADAADYNLQKIGRGFYALREKAKAFLDDAHHAALVEKLSRENEAKDAEIAALKRQVEELASLVNNIHSELATMKNAPSPLATVIPGSLDPVETAKAAASPERTGSALDELAAPKRRGRPRKDAA